MTRDRSTQVTLALLGLLAMSLVTGGWSRLPPLLEADFDWFALDGRRVLEAADVWWAGGDPYQVFGYLYSPLATIVAVPWAAAPEPIAIVVWLIVEVATAMAVTLVVTRGFATRDRLLAVAAVLCFRPVVVDLLLANATVVVSAAVLAMTWRDRAINGVPLGLIAAAVPKPFIVPFVVWALVHRRRSALGAIATGTIATAVGLVVAGPQAYVAFIRALATFGTVEFVGNEGLTFLSVPLAATVAVVMIVAFVIVLNRRGPVTSLVWASVLGIFVAPYVGGYAALPFLVAVPALLTVAPAMPLLSMAAFTIAGMIPIVGAGVVLALSALFVRPDPAPP